MPNSYVLRVGTGESPSPPSAEPDNMPAGMVTRISTDFSNGLPADGVSDPNYDFRYNSSAEDITAESGVAGSSNGFVAQHNFSIGFVGNGNKPGTLYPRGGVWPTSAAVYYRTRFRVSDPWDSHSTGTNKMGFFDLSSGNFYWGFTPRSQSGTKAWEIFVEVQTASPSGRMYATQNISAGQFDSAEWHWIEIYSDGPDDLIKVWVDGTLILDEDGTGLGAYSYSLGGNSFIEPSIEVLWGGAGDTKTSNDWVQNDKWVLASGDGTEF